MTLSTRGYSLGRNAWSYEAHFTAALPGRIHKVREQLRAIGIPFFQRLISQRYGQRIPLEKIRGEFEREEEALAPSSEIRVERLEITYRGKMHHAAKLPVLTLSSDLVDYDPEYNSNEGDIPDDEDFERVEHDEDSEDFDEDDEWEDADDEFDEEYEDEEYDDE
jgi:hypothetical protein